jgi:hypothetical protein
LGQLFLRGSDKTFNKYHILYTHILIQLGVENPLNVLEIGIGTNNPNLISTMGVDGTPDASVRALRDFLPNAHIYGTDIDKDILFQEERIKTTYVDQLNSIIFDQILNMISL